MMRKHLYLLLLFALAACNVEKDEDQLYDITAKINGETWYFYDVSTSNSEEGDVVLKANGYLEGDRSAQPANLEINFVGVKDLTSAGAGYTADFAPTSDGSSAWAVVRFPDLNRTFDTKLDPTATGTFTIENVENNTMSGNFKFKANDQQGNVLNIESANFKGISLSQ